MPFYTPLLLLLLMLAGGYLQGRVLRLLTDPNTDAAHLPRRVSVTNAVTLVILLAIPAYFALQARYHPFLLGPLGIVLLASFVGDFFRFDRLFEWKLKRYSSRLRAFTVTGHGGIAFGIGVALWDSGRLTGSFPTATLQILLAAAAGAAALVLEAILLPYFVTVSYVAERTRLRRAAWKMAVVRANLFFLYCAFAFGGSYVPESMRSLLAIILIVIAALWTPFVTLPRDARFLPDESLTDERQTHYSSTQGAAPIAALPVSATADLTTTTDKSPADFSVVQITRHWSVAVSTAKSVRRFCGNWWGRLRWNFRNGTIYRHSNGMCRALMQRTNDEAGGSFIFLNRITKRLRVQKTQHYAVKLVIRRIS